MKKHGVKYHVTMIVVDQSFRLKTNRVPNSQDDGSYLNVLTVEYREFFDFPSNGYQNDLTTSSSRSHLKKMRVGIQA